MRLRDMPGAPGRGFRMWRAGRRCRRMMLPLPAPGTEAHEWMAHFAGLRRPAPVRRRPRRRAA